MSSVFKTAESARRVGVGSTMTAWLALRQIIVVFGKVRKKSFLRRLSQLVTTLAAVFFWNVFNGNPFQKGIEDFIFALQNVNLLQCHFVDPVRSS